jgi:hypothetical protein
MDPRANSQLFDQAFELRSQHPFADDLSLSSGQGGGAPAELIDPTTLFDSDTGFIFDLSDAGTVFQEVAGTTTPSTNGDPLGTLLDLSGNDNHVDAINTSLRPNYVFDGSVGYADFNATAALDILQKAFTLAQPLTIIVSVRVDTTDLGEFFVDGGASSGLSFDPTRWAEGGASTAAFRRSRSFGRAEIA